MTLAKAAFSIWTQRLRLFIVGDPTRLSHICLFLMVYFSSLWFREQQSSLCQCKSLGTALQVINSHMTLYLLSPLTDFFFFNHFPNHVCGDLNDVGTGTLAQLHHTQPSFALFKVQREDEPGQKGYRCGSVPAP